ncbi:MAG: dUTP diphosphatase [Candidatus Shapirobacteria bacterium]|jgi:dUTP pyrophosphatase
MKLRIKRIDKSLPLPEYDKGAACFDFYCREDMVVDPGKIVLIPLNVAIQVPHGYVMLLFSRSSTPLKTGLIVPHGAGVVDPFYCGDKDEVLMEFMNPTDKSMSITKGQKLVQGMLVKTEEVEWEEKEEFLESGVGGYKLSA